MPKVKYLGVNPKPYSCHECQMGFTTEFARDRHLNTRHYKNKNDFYVCSVQNCGESFPRNDYRLRHQRKTHGIGRNSQGQGKWMGLVAAVWKLTGQRRGPRVKGLYNGFFRRGKKLGGNHGRLTADHRPALNVTIRRRSSGKNGGGGRVKTPVNPPPKPAKALILEPAKVHPPASVKVFPEPAKVLSPESAQVPDEEPIFEESDHTSYQKWEVDSEPEVFPEHFSREMFLSDLEEDSESEEDDNDEINDTDDRCFICLKACALSQEEYEEFSGSFEFHKFVNESLHNEGLLDLRTEDISKLKTCRSCQRKIQKAMAKALQAEENQMRIKRLKEELEMEEKSLEENQKAYQKSINKVILASDQVDVVEYLRFVDNPVVSGDLIGRVRSGLTSLASFSQFSQSQGNLRRESTPEVVKPGDKASGDAGPVNGTLANIKKSRRIVNFSPASMGSVNYYSETDEEELEKKRLADIVNKTGRSIQVDKTQFSLYRNERFKKAHNLSDGKLV